jgi:cytochrome c nitrite reductase small subunit
MGIVAWMASVTGGWRVSTMAALGVLTGMGIYLTGVSNGLSYLSDDPKTCINCHIMFPEYATWQHSSHRVAATCNDCHVPHDNIIRKYYFKGKDGSRHSLIFTLGTEPQAIYANPESRKVIQENCVRCHSRVLDDVSISWPHGVYKRNCVDCHRETPHGRVHSLSSTPNAAVPALSTPLHEWMTTRK